MVKMSLQTHTNFTRYAYASVRAVRAHQGFTLIEVMVVVAIIAILAAVAAPSFQRIMAANAAAGHVNAFMGDVRLARSEAIKRGLPVSMCRSSTADQSNEDNIVCTTASADVGWAAGWLLFVDRDGDGTRDSGDDLISVQQPLARMESAVQTSGTLNRFTFDRFGRSNGEGNLKFTPRGVSDDSINRKVCVNKLGRARLLNDSAADCS